MRDPYKALIDKAKEGNKEALEKLILGIQDQIYGLSLRMLGDPSHAEDAVQEILIKIITRLDGFRGESNFTTWTFRVASNYLLNKRKQLANIPEISADDYQEMLENRSAAKWPESIPEGERHFIVKEVMLTCTQGILLYLDLPHRISFILGEIFEMTSKQAAYILDISPAAFRKRLSRARNRLYQYMSMYCDLINPDGLCNCEKISPASVDIGYVDPNHLKFAKHPCHSRKDDVTQACLKELDSLQRIAAVYQSHPDYAAPESFLENIRNVIHSNKYAVFQPSQV